MFYKKDSYTGSLTSISLCTVAQVCESIGINSPSADLTAFLSSAIDRVSKKFESYCQLPLKEQSFIGHYNGSGTNILYVNNFPITSVTSIKYRSNPLNSYSNAITVSGCSIYSNKIISYNDTFPYGNLSIEIIYNAGYSTVPYDIEQIAIEATEIILKESNIKSAKSQNTLGELSRQADASLGFNTTFIDLNPRFKEVLDFYKKRRV